MSLRESVLAAIQSALVAANVASGRVYRSRTAALVTLPSVTVEPESETAAEEVLGMLTRTLTVAVAVFASGSPPDAAADATLALIESTLLADRTLGLGSEVQLTSQIDTAWDFDPEDSGSYDHTRIALRFTVSTRTAL